ncbi:fibronectin type III domain-containing protein [Halosimplex pelagicum]|uniref:Fibronectin type III domain-containing protein n=1 Tax=Halosimplex pelagicum TaxID=869886 RepID=A0A7D5P5V8_9EURY|nr:fibronectin type III domain-containing protein [Halosimplex pelagicum]QLH81623.1 fibronectin type III domain-containing protein [Halosimplex pelagicum]
MNDDHTTTDANRCDARGDRPDDGRSDDGTATATRRTALKTIGAAAAGGTVLSGRASAGVPTPRLHTDGKWIRDPQGNAVQLRGMATADPAFYRRTHPKSFEEVLRWATDTERGWHPNVVRLPFTQDNVAHYGIDTLISEFIRPAVEILASRDVYALVDFHLIRPYTQEATETYNSENEDTLDPIDDVMTNFWSAVAPEFADDEHVVYELFNEPTQPTMYGDDEGAWQTWRDAAQPWVDLVREHAPETPIIIGSPRWTSVTHMAPEYPFEGENLIYAAHIYPDNGAPSEFDQYYGEPANDVPVVVTEFGWDPNGGSVDQGTTSGWGEPFRQWAEGYANMGWISWCFDDSWAPTFFDSQGEGAAESWTLKTGDDQMGGYIKTWLSETKGDSVPASTVDDSTAPPAPGNPTVSNATEIGVDLSWDAVTDEGEAGLSHYTVYLDGERVQEALPGATTTTVGGLSPGTTYEFVVTAEDDAGNESDPATVVAETIARDAQQSPYNGPHTLPGRVEAEDFDEGGQGISYYDTTAANQGGASYRDTAVDIGTSAESGYNVGYISTGEWLEYTVQVESAGARTTRVNVSAGSGGGGALRVSVDGETLATQDVWQTGGWSNWQTIRVGDLDLPEGEHVVRVTAESGAWNFDWIEFGESSGSGDTTAPPAPANLSVTGTTSSSISVEWDAVTDTGGSGLDHYVLYVDGSQEQTVAAGTTSATVEELSAETAYQVAVSAVDGAGNESAMTSVSATTAAGGDTEAPSAPANLSVTGTSSSSVSVSWDAVADDGGSGLDHYVVSLDGSEDQTVPAGTTAATVEDLSADTAYEIGVAAVDGAGNESAAATVTATTAASDDGEDDDGETPVDALVVNDYDGDPSWSSHRNDLGQWCGAGSFENGGGEVVDGALELDYDNGGWFQEQINRSVEEYSTLVFEVSGANGGEESEVLFDMGGVRTMLGNVTDDSVGTSTGAVRVDLESAGIDRSVGDLSVRLNFWQGGSSVLAIEEIRLE